MLQICKIAVYIFCKIEVKTKADQRDIDKLKTLSGKLGFKDSYVISKEFVDFENVISVVDL